MALLEGERERGEASSPLREEVIEEWGRRFEGGGGFIGGGGLVSPNPEGGLLLDGERFEGGGGLRGGGGLESSNSEEGLLLDGVF